VGDSKKQADGKHIDDIIDSDELFDLDMPLDEPDNSQAGKLSDMLEDMYEEPAEEIQTIAAASERDDNSDSFQHLMDELPDQAPQDDETNGSEKEQGILQTVEQDIEHLLDHNPAHAGEPMQHTPPPSHAAAGSDSIHTSMPAETEPATDIPETEHTTEQPARSGIASSVMLMLGLIAILITALAGWLWLDASQQKSKLASVSSNLQQQIKLLEQQQKQQKTLLTQHIETLEKRVNTLTQVIANKTAEQWRTALQHTPASPKHAAIGAASLQSTPADMPATPEAASQPARHAAAQQPAKAKKPVIAPTTEIKTPVDTQPVAQTPRTTAPLSMYEVAPGTVKGWVVNIYSVTSRSTAEKRIRQLKAKDIDAKYVRVQIKGKTWYRVRASGFKDKHAAATFKQFLKDYQGIDAWYSYLK